MSIAIIAPAVIFTSFGFITLVGVIKPNKVVEMTAKWFRWSMKLYGFEGEIKPTPRAFKICRYWNLLMLFIFIFGLVLVLSGKLNLE